MPLIPDVLSGKGGTAEMPRGGVTGETGDEDGNAGALCAPACPRHHGDAGGRKLPPPTVHQVQHAGPLEGAEWAPPGNFAVCEKANRRPGARVARRWWEQTGIDWKGAQERAEAAEAAET